MSDVARGHILILSGSPGSGKTTMAEMLARLPGVPKVHIHSDDFWGNIKHGHIPPWLPESHEQNLMVMRIATDVAGHYARAGYFTVLDGVVRPFWLPAFVALGLPCHYIVLRTSVTEAVSRCLARGGDSLTDPDVVADLHDQFADLGPFSDHVLPVGRLSREEALEAITAALASGNYRLSAPTNATAG